MDGEIQGGCSCGALRYRVSAAPVLKAQCHCRACQHVSGGGPNYFMLVPPEGFAYVEGEPRQFMRPDLPNAVSRDFCAACGTHVLSRSAVYSSSIPATLPPSASTRFGCTQ